MSRQGDLPNPQKAATMDRMVSQNARNDGDGTGTPAELIVRDGTTLVYRVYGDRDDEPLLLVHGLGSNYSMWSPQITRYPDEGYFLIVPDMRGHGASDPVSTFEIDACADDLTAILDDIGVHETAIAGVSMGSLIAQVFALRYPDRLTRLVLSDTFSRTHGLRARIAATGATLGLSLMPSGLIMRLIESAHDDPEDEPLREYYRTQLQEMDRDQLVQARKAINRFDRFGDLGQIEVPTLVVVGGNNPDWFIRLGEETAEQIPNATFDQLAHGSDPSNLTATAPFDCSLLSFLNTGCDTPSIG